MRPVPVKDQNTDFTKPRDWDDNRDGPCGNLPVRVEVDGIRNMHYSNWRPDSEELKLLKRDRALLRRYSAAGFGRGSQAMLPRRRAPRQRGQDMTLKPSFIMHMLRWLIVGLIISLIVLVGHHARAMDHGFDDNSDFGQWVQSLKRPDTDYKYSCCGKGDLYGIRIEQDAIGDDDDARGVAVITDGGAITYPDKTQRSPIRNGTRFTFPKSVVNDRQGNPRGTAFAFLTPGMTPGTEDIVMRVWCVIPLPPGS